MNWETLMCFGDSITIGARSYCGYPEYAGAELQKTLGNKWNVINHSVSGYTAIDLARYITGHFSNLRDFAPGIVTILIGTNDVKKNTGKEDFRIAYEQVVLKAMLLAPSKNVVLIRIPAFPRNIAYPYNYGMNALIHEFNNVISRIAGEWKLRVMDLAVHDNDLYDGVHLSAQGSANCGQQLAQFIKADKGITAQEGEQDARFIALHG
jgi:lysophospholipase L1-like esterase